MTTKAQTSTTTTQEVKLCRCYNPQTLQQGDFQARALCQGLKSKPPGFFQKVCHALTKRDRHLHRRGPHCRLELKQTDTDARKFHLTDHMPQ